MKTREEEIRIASNECYLEEVKQMDVYLGQAEEWTKGITFGFIRGAKWVDKTVIDKACQWLEENYYNVYQGTWQEIKEQFISDFRKAMEE